MKSIKTIFITVISLMILGIVWYSGFRYSFVKKNVNINQDIILEQVKNVIKLGTVEGYFSEIYDYQDYYGLDLSIFRKKALIRVKAKILAGFNLDSIKINIDEKSKTVFIENVPPPSILSIEHNLDYYDITEGTFNSFTKDDYNNMNSQAKKLVKKTALKSGILTKAKEQLDTHIELLKSIINNYGWQIKINYSENKSEIYQLPG
ncbi:MAG: DUF4230 domain-containing protein [Saprospiraceae bacterium]